MEHPELFEVVATNPTQGATLVQNANMRGIGVAWATITDDDPGTPGSTIITVYSRVRQPLQLIVDFIFNINNRLTEAVTLNWDITNINIPTTVWDGLAKQGTIALAAGDQLITKSVGFGATPNPGFTAGTQFTMRLRSQAGATTVLSPDPLTTMVTVIRTS